MSLHLSGISNISSHPQSQINDWTPDMQFFIQNALVILEQKSSLLSNLKVICFSPHIPWGPLCIHIDVSMQQEAMMLRDMFFQKTTKRENFQDI